MTISGMMTPDEFKTAWEGAGETLARFPLDRLSGRGLSPTTIAFLQGAGLPEEAAPFLAFGISSRPIEPPEREGHLLIGSDGSGSPIVIAASGRIEVFDHDRGFAPTYLSKDVGTLAQTLLQFRALVAKTQEVAGPDAYLDAAVPPQLRDEFSQFLHREDPQALEPGAFWASEIGAWA